MLAVRVRYHGPTATRGAKLVATDSKKYIRVAYQYGSEDQEKLAVAQQFAKQYYPYSELEKTPFQFNGDDFYPFRARPDMEKVHAHVLAILDHYQHSDKNQTYNLNKEQLEIILARAVLTYHN